MYWNKRFHWEYLFDNIYQKKKKLKTKQNSNKMSLAEQATQYLFKASQITIPLESSITQKSMVSLSYQLDKRKHPLL